MDQAIIFCRTKVDCDNLESYLNSIGNCIIYVLSSMLVLCTINLRAKLRAILQISVHFHVYVCMAIENQKSAEIIWKNLNKKWPSS